MTTCPSCAAPIEWEVSQTVFNGRLAWSASYYCAACGDGVMVDGWDEPPDDVREALIAEDGLRRVRLDRDRQQPSRVALMSVFRRRGASLSRASELVAEVASAGLTGTFAEIELLSAQLAAVGAAVVVDAAP